jgi:hypothetical protein
MIKNKTNTNQDDRDSKNYIKHVYKLCEQKFQELTHEESQAINLPRGIHVVFNKGHFRIYHLDRNTCDWTQTFKTRNDTLSVATWFGKLHRLSITVWN